MAVVAGWVGPFCLTGRVSNTPGNLLEIIKVCWKFSGLVREFANLLLTLAKILVFQSVSVHDVSKMPNLRCVE